MTEPTPSPLFDDALLAGVPVVAGYPYLEPCLLFREVGAGTFGKVYQARHLRYEFPFDCAVKCLKGGHELGRFRREATIGARLSHSNLVRVHGLHRFGHLHYLVMEWVDGETVEARLRDARARANDGRLDPAEAVEIVRQAAEGVAALHAENVYHRDIKPANLMIRVDGVVKVADLGIAKSTAPDGTELTEAGQGFGTPGYMPLEQFEGADGAEAPADVFALGAVLYRMLTGRAGLPGNQVQTYAQLKGDGFPRLVGSEFAPQLPDGLAELVDACTVTAPAERIADARELVERLTALGLPRVNLEFGDDERATLVVGGTTDGPTKSDVEAATREVDSGTLIAPGGLGGGLGTGPGGTEIVAPGGTSGAPAAAAAGSTKARRTWIAAAVVGVAVIVLVVVLTDGGNDGGGGGDRAGRDRTGGVGGGEVASSAPGSHGTRSNGTEEPTGAALEDRDDGDRDGAAPGFDESSTAPAPTPRDTPSPANAPKPTVMIDEAAERRASLDGLDTTASVELTALTANAARVLIEVDGGPAVEQPVGSDGSFSHALELAAGTHAVRLTPVGAGGAKGASRSVTVQVDPSEDLLPGFAPIALADLGGDRAAGERVGYRPLWRDDVNVPLADLVFVDAGADAEVPLFALTEWSWGQSRALRGATDDGRRFGPPGTGEEDQLPARFMTIDAALEIVARLNELVPEDAPIEFVVPTSDEWSAFSAANGAGANEIGHVTPTSSEAVDDGGDDTANPNRAVNGAGDQGPVVFLGGPTCAVTRFPQGATRIRCLAGNVSEICFTDEAERRVALAGEIPEKVVARGSSFRSGPRGLVDAMQTVYTDGFDETVGLRIAVRFRE